MDHSEGTPAAASGLAVVAALGGLYVAFAIGWALTPVSAGLQPLDRTIVASIIGVPGAIVLLGAARLPRSAVEPSFYSTVAVWCLVGIGSMGAILTIYHAQPGTGISEPVRSVPVLTALSCVAGFAVGVYDARAKTNERRLEERNRDLEQLRAELEASNERLEQFAYAASHDLKEPLRMVTSYLDLLERRYGNELDEDATEFIAYAVDGAERMDEMIQGLLEYSRVETQGEPFEAVDLESTVDDVLADLELVIDEADAEIAIDDLPLVAGDERQLRQVFQNLLHNAIEYSGEEPPRVAVEAERDGREWILRVVDDGIGIDPDHQERVFEVFQRLHARDEHPGTGLGLALCQRIVERHDGEIWVDSTPDEGSTFAFTLRPADDPPATVPIGQTA